MQINKRRRFILIGALAGFVFALVAEVIITFFGGKMFTSEEKSLMTALSYYLWRISYAPFELFFYILIPIIFMFELEAEDIAFKLLAISIYATPIIWALIGALCGALWYKISCKLKRAQDG